MPSNKYDWATRHTLNGSDQEHLNSMLQHFATASRAHFVDHTQSIPLFFDVVEKKTEAYFSMWAGAKEEQRVFCMCLPIAMRHQRHYLTNFVVHRFFYHPQFSQTIQFAFHEDEVINTIKLWEQLGKRHRTNAYQRLTESAKAKRVVRQIFAKIPPFWEEHRNKAFLDSFPVLELLAILSKIDEFGPLNCGLVIQDLATAGIITNAALTHAMEARGQDGADQFELLGPGGQEGLALMLTPANKTNKTCNQQLLHLYRVHRPHLLTLLKRGKETWDNVTTIEHNACKF